MVDDELAAILGGFDRFALVRIRREPSSHPPRLVLELEAKRGYPKRCSRCGEMVREVHEVIERRVRDLPIADWEPGIVFPRARVQCPRCGPTVEALAWVDRYQRMTKRLVPSSKRWRSTAAPRGHCESVSVPAQHRDARRH